MAAGQIRYGLKLLTGSHACLSLISLAHGTLSEGSLSSSVTNGSREDDEAFDAKHYGLVTDLVYDMYSGKGTDAVSKRRRPGVGLDDDVVFEDPAAVCIGKDELREAFRALGRAHPRCLSRPRCIDVVPRLGTVQLTYRLDQSYVEDRLRLSSLLIVDVRLAPVPGDGTISELRVSKFEERWNGVEPLLGGGYPFWISRRINGLISWCLTSLLL